MTDGIRCKNRLILQLTKDFILDKRVFVVFDLLFFNNQEYYQKPLVERLEALNSEIFNKTDPNFVFISEKKEM